jgi:hypothetical protein
VHLARDSFTCFFPLIRPFQRFAFTGTGVDVDSVWEQKKLKATQSEMLVNRAESPASSAPWNDGRRSFSTRERPAVSRRCSQKTAVLEENDAFFTVFG